MRFLGSLVSKEAGATAIEYALVASLVSIVCIGALVNVGDNLDVLYSLVAAMTEAVAGS